MTFTITADVSREERSMSCPSENVMASLEAALDDIGELYVERPNGLGSTYSVVWSVSLDMPLVRRPEGLPLLVTPRDPVSHRS